MRSWVQDPLDASNVKKLIISNPYWLNLTRIKHYVSHITYEKKETWDSRGEASDNHVIKQIKKLKS